MTGRRGKLRDWTARISATTAQEMSRLRDWFTTVSAQTEQTISRLRETAAYERTISSLRTVADSPREWPRVRTIMAPALVPARVGLQTAVAGVRARPRLSAAAACALIAGLIPGAHAGPVGSPAAADPAGADGPAAAASGLRLVVNVPAFRLDVYRNGERIRSYPVAVGMPGHATPTGSYTIKRAVWNPWWHPPDRGWAAGQAAVPPGPNNPMGRVKLYFRPLYYIHGTPLEGSLGSAASHGCIRMRNEDAIELARLVHRYASPGVSSGEVAWLVSHEDATQTVGLSRRVELDVIYRVAEVHDGALMIHPDVYGRVGAGELERLAVRALARAGHPGVDASAVEDLVAEARRGVPVNVPVRALTLGTPVHADGP